MKDNKRLAIINGVCLAFEILGIAVIVFNPNANIEIGAILNLVLLGYFFAINLVFILVLKRTDIDFVKRLFGLFLFGELIRMLNSTQYSSLLFVCGIVLDMVYLFVIKDRLNKKA